MPSQEIDLDEMLSESTSEYTGKINLIIPTVSGLYLSNFSYLSDLLCLNQDLMINIPMINLEPTGKDLSQLGLNGKQSMHPLNWISTSINPGVNLLVAEISDSLDCPQTIHPHSKVLINTDVNPSYAKGLFLFVLNKQAYIMRLSIMSVSSLILEPDNSQSDLHGKIVDKSDINIIGEIINS